MNTVMIIPTGIGCPIGGHAGDATPAARLLAAVSDLLILHPNVVNASDINEMPTNSWYVEGSILDRFLAGRVRLFPVRENRILLAVNPPLQNETINAVNAARTTLGADIDIVELDHPLIMTARFKISEFSGGQAGGIVKGWDQLVEQVNPFAFDALAIQTPIYCPDEVALQYFERGGVNPWGGVEALASRLIAGKLHKPVAHAPYSEATNPREVAILKMRVDPRMAAEAVSNCYLFCILKGLHKAPRIITHPNCVGQHHKGLLGDDVDCLVSPAWCWGPPHRACVKNNIPIIMVRENKPLVAQENIFPMMEGNVMEVDNYLEAAGMIAAMGVGMKPWAVKRPIPSVSIRRSGRYIEEDE
jgi:hypothetical protein